MRFILCFLVVLSISLPAQDVVSTTGRVASATVGSFSALGFLDDAMRASVKRLAYARTNMATQAQWLTGSGGVNTNCWIAPVDMTWASVLNSFGTNDVGWTSLIASNVAIGAAHKFPAVGQLVVYRTSGGILHTNKIAAITNGVNDLAVLTLTSNVISGITPASLFHPSVTNYLSWTASNGTNLSFNGSADVAFVHGNTGNVYIQAPELLYSLFRFTGGQMTRHYATSPALGGGDSGAPYFAVLGTNAVFVGAIFNGSKESAPLWTNPNWNIITNATAGNHRTFDLTGYAQRSSTPASSPWVPANEGTVLMDLDARTVNIPTGTTTNYWPDSSGNGYGASQDTAGYRLTFLDATQGTNGMKCFFADGTDDYMILSNVFSGVTAATAFFVVGHDSDLTPSNNRNTPWTVGGSGQVSWFPHDSGIYDDFASNTRRSTASIDYVNHNKPYIITSAGNNSGWNLYINGTNIITSGANTVAWSGTPTISASSTQKWKGVFFRLIIYSELLSGTSRSNVITQLKLIYGTP